jgi:hypothetical protein
MSKHKVTRYDVGGDVDEMEEANKRENLDTEAGPKAMPRRPISRTPASDDSRTSGPGRKPTGPSKSDYSNEGKSDSKYRKVDMTPESQAIQRVYPEQYLIGGPGIKGVASAAQNLARTGAKEAPAAVSAARGALDRAMAAERAAPKTGDMGKISDALKTFKNKGTKMDKDAWLAGPKGPLGRKSTPQPKPRPKTAAERDAIGRADTLDEFGGAMKRGGSVKRYASGGSIGSFRSSADGIAQRGKTRGVMMCGGGMAKGRK